MSPDGRGTSHIPSTDSNVDRNDCCSMLQLFPEWLRTLDISLLCVITRKILDLFDEFTTKEKEANGNKITFEHVFLYILYTYIYNIIYNIYNIYNIYIYNIIYYIILYYIIYIYYIIERERGRVTGKPTYTQRHVQFLPEVHVSTCRCSEERFTYVASGLPEDRGFPMGFPMGFLADSISWW